MSLWGTFDDNGNLEKAYKAEPRFYNRPETGIFGAFALTENTLTLLPKEPKDIYLVDGQTVTSWVLSLVSTTENTMLGYLDYYEALEKLSNYVVYYPDREVLVRGLTSDELKELLSSETV